MHHKSVLQYYNILKSSYLHDFNSKSLNQDVSVTRDGLANEIQQVKQQEIMTDSSISQSRHVEVERELERWVPDDDDRECPELDNIFDGPWNRLVIHIAILFVCVTVG